MRQHTLRATWHAGHEHRGLPGMQDISIARRSLSSYKEELPRVLQLISRDFVSLILSRLPQTPLFTKRVGERQERYLLCDRHLQVMLQACFGVLAPLARQVICQVDSSLPQHLSPREQQQRSAQAFRHMTTRVLDRDHVSRQLMLTQETHPS